MKKEMTLCINCKYATELTNCFDMIFPPNEYSYCKKHLDQDFQKMLKTNPVTGDVYLNQALKNKYSSYADMPFCYPTTDYGKGNIGDFKPYKTCCEINKKGNCEDYELNNNSPYDLRIECPDCNIGILKLFSFHRPEENDDRGYANWHCTKCNGRFNSDLNGNIEIGIKKKFKGESR